MEDGTGRRIASIAYYFVTMNMAIAVGFWRWVRGTQKGAWERTARLAEVARADGS